MCTDIVSSVDDLDEARAIYFILKSAQHLNLVFKIVHVSTNTLQPPYYSVHVISTNSK